MLTKEYRIPLPLSVEEYQIGQLYSVVESSKNETGGGEGVEFVVNEPFTGKPLLGNQYSSGQYTHKIYHLKKKVPTLIKLMAPRGALELHEESWNSYPFCRTILTNPSYMRENFKVVFESIHLPDRGGTENALGLSPSQLEEREVVNIDICNDPVLPGDYQAKYDPTTYYSTKTKRGPFVGNWAETHVPVMTCYKYLAVDFKWFGLQTRTEGFLQRMARRIFTVFHRQVVCTLDDWVHYSLADIRKLEEDTKHELDEMRQKKSFQGNADLN